jgi:trimeric autotransporter adhesin
VDIGSPSATTTVQGTFVNSSDRNLKEGIQPVEPAAVLARLLQLPVSTWKFRGSDGRRHVGPMAQDFHAAFGLGAHETAIATVDADGVALAAIQGLNQKLEEQLARKDAEIQKLKTSLAELKELVSQFAGQRNGGMK